MAKDLKPSEVSEESSNSNQVIGNKGSQMVTMQDIFEVTGYSHKPFYKLTKEEANALGAKENKKQIFFKGVLIRGNSVTTRKAIVDMDWIQRKKDLWAGKPITILHPEFKGHVKMAGRKDYEVVQDLLKYQEPFGVGRIMKVDSNPADPNLMDFYGLIDNPGLVKGIENGDVKLPRYGSPYIWALGEIDETNFDTHGHFLVRDHYPIHWAFVPRPAMGPSVEVKAMCTGEELECVSKMQAFSDDSEYSLDTCPCTIIKENFGKDAAFVDNSFYLSDPLTQLTRSIMTNESNSNGKEIEIGKKFMENPNSGNTTLIKPPNTGSMPPTDNPDGEQGPPNPGEHVDRNKAENKDETQPEEKPEMEKLIEDVRAKAEKSTAKKYEKVLSEKDAEISKLNKTISELTFKEKESIINEALPNELFGNKEDDIKKAEDERAFYVKLAKEKNMSTEELSRILGRNTIVRELKVGVGSSSSNKKGQANNSADSGITNEQVRDYMLGTGDPSSKSKTSKNPPGVDIDKAAINSFFGI